MSGMRPWKAKAIAETPVLAAYLERRRAPEQLVPDFKPGDRVQWLDMPGYSCGTVKEITPTGVRVELDTGLQLNVGEYNVPHSLRKLISR